MKRNLLVGLLCMILVLTHNLYLQAKGNEEQKADIQSQQQVIQETYINPLYEDVISADDLKQTDDSEKGITVLSDLEYDTSIPEAALRMRECLKNREETFEIGIQRNAYDSALAKIIAEEAMIHTQNPVEGDYLRWQYAGWNMTGSYYTSNNICYIRLVYTVTYYTTQEQENQLDQAVHELLEQMNLQDQNDYVKIKTIYDYICNNVVYDYENLEDDSYKLKYTAYAALVQRKAVCQGYAVLFYRLALEEAVDARLISGTGNGEAHGWNIAELNDLYYNLDATWDAGRSEYRYFLKCDETFGNHVRDEEYSDSDFYAAYPMGTSDYQESGESSGEPSEVPSPDFFQIISQPDDYTGNVGEIAVFSIEAEGKNLTFQWQYANAGKTLWRNSGQPGNGTDTLSVPITRARNGQKYRCVITDGSGNRVVSDEAVILIKQEEETIIVTKQPSDYTGSVGSTASFTVEAEGENLTYQWQYCNMGYSTWKNSGQRGNQTSALNVPITVARDGQKYRCVITDGSENCVVSDEAVILIKQEEELIIVTKQPSDYTGSVGSTASFTVEAEGEDLTYQWQYCNVGYSTWKNSGQRGNQTSALNVPITAARDGQKYRCVITDGSGNCVVSDEAVILIKQEEELIIVTKQPSDYTGSVGSTASFTVEAEGEDLTYQWQYCNVGYSTWKNSGQRGNQTSALNVPITTARDGQKYRCVITDGNGNSVITDTAVLHAKTSVSKITITSQP